MDDRENNNIQEEFGLLTFGLYYDIIERIRTLDKNIVHTYQLAQYLHDVYDDYYKSKGNPINIYGPYINVLKLMIDDLKDLKRILKCIKEQMLECYEVRPEDGISGNNYMDFINLSKIFFKNIKYKGFPKNNPEYNQIYQKWVNKKIDEYKNQSLTPLSTNEFLLEVRGLVVRDHVLPIEISIGSLLDSFSGITHSLYQSLGGLYIGHTIEHEPSVYPHKDMSHIMEFGSLYYCKGYQEFWKLLLKESLNHSGNADNNEISELFYNISGMDISNNSSNSSDKLGYTIVFGDSQLPEVFDRYKLIKLPLTCAYRPRYWSALAHEVSHSFITSLLLFEHILNDIEIYNDEDGKKAKYILKLKDINKNKDDKNKINYIAYIYNIIDYVFKRLTTESYFAISLKLKRHPYNFRFKNVYVGEIVADIFGFLFSGYAYIPSIVANLVFDVNMKPLSLVRLGVILGIAEEFYYDVIKNKKIFNNLQINNNIKKGIIKDFSGILYGENNNEKIDDSENKVFKFIKAFERIITYDLIPTVKFKKSLYYYALGKDLSTDLYNSILKDFIKDILNDKNIKCFGWFNYNEDNENKHYEFYVLLNILLNNTCIKRISNLYANNGKSDYKKITELCESVESMKLISQMKKLKWEFIQSNTR